jgi:hypothetical protein
MRTRLFLCQALAGALACTSCQQVKVTAEGGYTQMAIEGDMALDVVSGGGAGSLRQDESAFGLGDPQGSPYVRAKVDFGVPVLKASGFLFEEQGQGRLTANFGNITAGTDVRTDLDFTNVKGSLTFEIPLGPLSLAPGVAVDFIDLDMVVQDTLGIVTEDIEVQAPIPLLFLSAELDLGRAGVVGEFGYMQVHNYRGVDGAFVDLELLADLRLSGAVHVFGGYRYIDLDADGDIDNQSFVVDLSVSGWIIGGGVRF